MTGGRPEHTAPPQLFYNDIEARKYTENTRIISIQNEMTYRALELLALPEDQPSLLLDIGCGSGLSGEVLSEQGHTWVGFDISPSMLAIANERFGRGKCRNSDSSSSSDDEEEESNDEDSDAGGDLVLCDIGRGLGLRPGCFDGAISISVIQWLCNADASSHVPRQRLRAFFTSLYTCLARGARAIFQFYPESPYQTEMILSSAMKCGFTGGLVVDYPNSTKAKKYFLCLFAGTSTAPLPQPLLEDEGEGHPHRTVPYERARAQRGRQVRGNRKPIKDKDWVLRKKDLNRRRGQEVPSDSKYTARKRKPKF